MSTPSPFPDLLRRWRRARALSQERLAARAEISPRHLSCLETGKARPSREMVLILANALDLGLGDRNLLLGCAGLAAQYPVSAVDSLSLAPVREAFSRLLDLHNPHGAVLIDACWNVIEANAGARRLFDTFLHPTQTPPAVAGNLVRAALHPRGLRPYFLNAEAVAGAILGRLERAVALFPEDAARRALLDEVQTYPGVRRRLGPSPAGPLPVAVAHLRKGDVELRLFTMLTTLGTPLDVTASDLTLESLLPADAATAAWFGATAALTPRPPLE
jgi:transcriptional regulator with XRE-family HTH domain